MTERARPSRALRIGGSLAAGLLVLGLRSLAWGKHHPPPEGTPPRPTDSPLPAAPREPAPDPEPEPEQSEPEPDEDAAEVRTITVPTRSDGLTASGRTIDARTIAGTPKRSAEDLLRLVPGVVIVQHGNQGKGYQFYLRGFDAAHGSDVEVSLEDVPLNEPSNVHAHGYLDLAFIIPEVVDGVDAKKGAFRLEQGKLAASIGRFGRFGCLLQQQWLQGDTGRHGRQAGCKFAPELQPGGLIAMQRPQVLQLLTQRSSGVAIGLLQALVDQAQNL